MARLIDADKLKEQISVAINSVIEGDETEEELKLLGLIKAALNVAVVLAPTVEAEPVRHGRWIEKETTIQCSNCGKEYNDEIRCMCYGEDAELNHCPRCGAYMDVEE